MKNQTKQIKKEIGDKAFSTPIVIIVILIIIALIGGLYILINDNQYTNSIKKNQSSDSRVNIASQNTTSIKSNLPPDATKCLVKLYGSDYERKLISGEIDANEMQNSISGCMTESTETQRRQTSSAFEAFKHLFAR